MAKRLNRPPAGSRDGKANARRMWFRRRRRQAQLDLSALDGLADLVERIVALLPDQGGRRQPQPPQEPIQTVVRVQTLEPPPEPEPDPDPEPAPERVERVEEAVQLLFVASPSGYRVVERAGPAPAHGDRLELAGAAYRVVRLGPSPLPGDRRRCAFLAREEPSTEARTPDG